MFLFYFYIDWLVKNLSAFIFPFGCFWLIMVRYRGMFVMHTSL